MSSTSFSSTRSTYHREIGDYRGTGIADRCTLHGRAGPLHDRQDQALYGPSQPLAAAARFFGRPPRKNSSTSLREKLIKIGAKLVSHGRYVTFQMAESAVLRQMFAEILSLIAQLRAPPAPA